MWEFSLKSSKNVRPAVLLQSISSGHLVTQGLKSRGQKSGMEGGCGRRVNAA